LENTYDLQYSKRSYKSGGVILNEKLLEITKIEIQKKNRDRMSIYINEEFAFGVHKDIAFKFNLEVGKKLDIDFIEKIIKTEEQNKANNYALKLLSYRPRSEKEIIDKMKGKGYDEEIINGTIDYLKNFGYVNDKDFAVDFAKGKSGKFGPNRIKIELVRKGVDDNIIDEIIKEEFDEKIEYNNALKAAKKKIKSYKGDDRNTIYRKLGSYLQRKGYSYDIVAKVLREVLELD
jgi:regulatory protein